MAKLLANGPMTEDDFKDLCKKDNCPNFSYYFSTIKHMIPAGTKIDLLEKIHFEALYELRASANTVVPTTVPFANLPVFQVHNTVKNIVSGEKAKITAWVRNTDSNGFTSETFTLISLDSGLFFEVNSDNISKFWENEKIMTTSSRVIFNPGDDVISDLGTKARIVSWKTIFNPAGDYLEYTLFVPKTNTTPYTGATVFISETDLRKNWKHDVLAQASQTIITPPVPGNYTINVPPGYKIVNHPSGSIHLVHEGIEIVSGGPSGAGGSGESAGFNMSTKQNCDHVFVDYTGFNDHFRFCKKCDMKEKA